MARTAGDGEYAGLLNPRRRFHGRPLQIPLTAPETFNRRCLRAASRRPSRHVDAGVENFSLGPQLQALSGR